MLELEYEIPLQAHALECFVSSREDCLGRLCSCVCMTRGLELSDSPGLSVPLRGGSLTLLPATPAPCLSRLTD